MSDPVAALREGLQDRYGFERELGRGGMATVYLARDLRHERPVVMPRLDGPQLSAELPKRWPPLPVHFRLYRSLHLQ
jgi:serine/threonine-protein kinase